MNNKEFKKYVREECERQWNENQKEEYGKWSKQDDDTKAEYYNDMYKQKIDEKSGNTLKTYKIPVDYSMFGDMLIKAKSLDEAREIAQGPQPLPPNAYYLEDSIQIDEDVLNEYIDNDDLIQ